jgi:hypothetical protein
MKSINTSLIVFTNKLSKNKFFINYIIYHFFKFILKILIFNYEKFKQEIQN